MKRYVLLILIILNATACSALKLNDLNAQATAQFDNAVAATLEREKVLQANDVPHLLFPQDGASIPDDEIILDWEFIRPLASDERFEVHIAGDNTTLQPLILTQESYYDVGEWIHQHPHDSYIWAVEVVQISVTGTVQTHVSLLSPLSAFSVEGIHTVDIDATFTAIAADQATIVAATVESIFALTPTPSAEVEATAEAEITVEPETTVEAEMTVEPEITPESLPDFIASSASIHVFGQVPIDSDSLDTITALTFDEAGRLLIGLRSGKIYALVDSDSDGLAEAPKLIFDDSGEDLSQVIGIFAQNEVLYSINGRQLSRLEDTDGDGIYDTVTLLTDELPDTTGLLQASNGFIRSTDGRFFTADAVTGEILQIVLVE